MQTTVTQATLNSNYITKYLITDPLGNSFVSPSTLPLTSSWETSTFSGKQSCFPQDQ